MPSARRHLVDRKRWITDGDMTELLSLAQLLPGPNIVNVAIMLGTRFRGAPGAIGVAVLVAIAEPNQPSPTPASQVLKEALDPG